MSAIVMITSIKSINIDIFFANSCYCYPYDCYDFF